MKSIWLAKTAGKEDSKLFDPVKGLGVFEALGGNVALIGLLVDAGRLEEARKMATRDDASMMPRAVPLLVEGYAAKGETAKVEELLGPNLSGEAAYYIYVAAAKGASKRAGPASRPAR